MKIAQTFSTSYKQVSYRHGVGKFPILYKSIGQRLYEMANKYPDNLALGSAHQDTNFTYSQLYQQAELIAASFLKLGLKKHDRIGIYSPNNYQWTITQFAASLADLILVNINPAYQTNELEFCLNKVNCKALVMANQFKKSNYIKMIHTLAPEIPNCKPGFLQSKRLPDMKILIKIDDEQQDGFFNFKDLYTIPENHDVRYLRDVASQVNPDDPTNIQFTSGTTGKPKGATLSHLNILNNAYFSGQRIKLTHEDRICIPVPLYHTFGMVLGNLCAINFGASMILPSEAFNPLKTMQAVTKYQCTTLYGVPTMFLEYLKVYEKNPQQFDISKLRAGIVAGALCPEVLMQKILSVLGLRDMTNAYGMTESSPLAFQTLPNDEFDDRCQTVGVILPNVEAKIVDKFNKTVPVNQVGEVCFRGYNIMSHYFNDELKTKEAIDKHGWLYSGDLGVMDERGYLKIVGRIKDMIIRGGENIYPKEIEEYLITMPEIDQVQVVGVPDEKYGEETFALIKLKDDNQMQKFDIKKIYKFCDQQIAHYKIPKYVKLVKEFPLTVTGKYQKFIMVETLLKEMNKDQKNFEKYIIRKY